MHLPSTSNAMQCFLDPSPSTSRSEDPFSERLALTSNSSEVLPGPSYFTPQPSTSGWEETQSSATINELTVNIMEEPLEFSTSWIEEVRAKQEAMRQVLLHEARSIYAIIRQHTLGEIYAFLEYHMDDENRFLLLLHDYLGSVRRSVLILEVFQYNLAPVVVMEEEEEEAQQQQQPLQLTAEVGAEVDKSLQACWRGYFVRRNVGCIRKRYTTVLKNWNITNSFGELLVFVQVIDTDTRLSRELSEEFSANHLKMLFQTIGHCNRSIPASHVLEFATSILVNLVKHEDSMQNVWKVDLVKVLLRLMSGWCGKSSTIFCNCCTVLWLLAQDPQKATDILEAENVKTMLLKFYDLEKSRSKREKKTSQKEEAKVNKRKLPDLTPEWKILKRKRPRTFQDPLFAVTSLMKKLGLKKEN